MAGKGDGGDAPGSVRYRSRAGRLVLLACILGSGMAFLDTTAVNVALPTMGRDLGTGFAGFQWVVNAFLLTLGALVLLGGTLGDRLGRRRAFLAGVAVFAAASLACALAPGTTSLVAFRAVQGVGAALMVPTSLALVQATFREKDRAEAIGAWSGFSGISTLVGPLLGGWLADAVSWRAVFLINLPLAAMTAWVALRHVPGSRDPGSPGAPDPAGAAGPPDLAGAAAAVLALGGVVFALIEGPELGWGHPAVLAAGGAGLLAAAAFPWIEGRADAPMLPLAFFRIRPFTGANLTTLGVYAALGGLFFLLTLQLQRVLGYSALEAGAAAAPVTFLLLLMSPRAGRLAERIGPRGPMTVGPLVAAAGAWLLSGVDAGSGYLTGVLPGILVFGLGLGTTVAPLTATALGALEEGHAGLASGVNNAVARIAQLLAVALLPLGAGISGIDEVAGPAFSAGFARGARLTAAVLAGSGALAWFLIRGRIGRR